MAELFSFVFEKYFFGDGDWEKRVRKEGYKKEEKEPRDG